MVRRAIHCNKKNEKFAKLCYKVRGSYYILRNTGRGSYVVKKLHKHNSPELKLRLTISIFYFRLLSLVNLLIP